MTSSTSSTRCMPSTSIIASTEHVLRPDKAYLMRRNLASLSTLQPMFHMPHEPDASISQAFGGFILCNSSKVSYRIPPCLVLWLARRYFAPLKYCHDQDLKIPLRLATAPNQKKSSEFILDFRALILLFIHIEDSMSGLLDVSIIPGHRRHVRSAPSSPHRRSGYTVVKRSNSRLKSRSTSRSSSRGRSRIVRRSRSRSPSLPRNRSTIIVRRSGSRSPSRHRYHRTTTSKNITVVKRERSLSASPPTIYISRGRSRSPQRRAQYESNSHSHVRTVCCRPSVSVSPSRKHHVARAEVYTNSPRRSRKTDVTIYRTNNYDLHDLPQHTHVVRRSRSAQMVKKSPHYRRHSPEESTTTIIKRKVYYID